LSKLLLLLLLLFHDRLLLPISQHSVLGEITSHNLLPLKRDQFIALLALARRSWDKYLIP